ncbi:hypothetical protein DFH28DRAFT_882423 [Melampsora americana]|nr:hypothetical protein DFH28DRAFT_882423 [Melampsora americana]
MLTSLLLRTRFESDGNDQFDLPALKQLYLISASDIFLSNFKECKNLQFIQYQSDQVDEKWESIQDHLYTYTWPKLSVFDLRQSWLILKSSNQGKKEVGEFWNLKIKLLLN